MLGDYPCYFNNPRVEELETFRKAISRAIDEYAKAHPEHSPATDYLRQSLDKYISEKKASLYVEHKVDELSDYLSKSLHFALHGNLHTDGIDHTKVWYYKNRNHFISHE